MVRDAPRGRGFATERGFVLAAVGSAVGLGNLWKFPYITGTHGGGAFVLVYLLCIAVVGWPLMHAELMIGRRGGDRGGGGVIDALARAAQGRAKPVRRLALGTGGLAVVASVMMLSFYAVVAGWALHSLYRALTSGVDPSRAAQEFASMRANAVAGAAWATVFLAMTVAVVVLGVQRGIERASRVLMGGLLLLLVALLIYVGCTGGLGQSLHFLFAPDFSALSGEAVLAALSHAFFSLSLGIGAMITYGSYTNSDRHVLRDGVAIVVLDTGVALLAGTVIFAAVFRAGSAADHGPGLLFATMPALFSSMPGGGAVGVAFFSLVVCAAWSSAIALLEVPVAFLSRGGRSRVQATAVAATICWVGAVACAVAPRVYAAMESTVDHLLPIGGLLVAILAGHLLDRSTLAPPHPRLAVLWTVSVRWIAPALVAGVLAAQI